MANSIRVTVDQAALKDLERDPTVLAAVGQVAEAAAKKMRNRAPKRTGAGAESIHVEPDEDNPGFRIGWDVQHFYMTFDEFGTQKEPARPFMRPTADEFTSR